MRCFRLRERDAKTKQIIKHRDYVGIDNLIKHGKETYKRYNRVKKENLSWDKDGKCIITECEPIQITYPELCENINGKWVMLSDDDVNNIFNYEEKLNKKLH